MKKNTKLTQEIIAAYEQYITDVHEACAFLKTGSKGRSRESISSLIAILSARERKMWSRIEREIVKDND